jgi:hypothetical protein
MREFLTSGSVGGVGGDSGSYPEAEAASPVDEREGRYEDGGRGSQW